MTTCYRCGLPQFVGPAGHTSPLCRCWEFDRPQPPAYIPMPKTDGCKPAPPITEADIRRIVREELANHAKERDMTTISINGTTYTMYRKTNTQPLRPYIPGEDLTGVSVNKEDTPEPGGMIACNPKNPDDKWYVAKQFFLDNYVEA